MVKSARSIAQLRFRFILTAMLALVLTLAVLCVVTSALFFAANTTRADAVIDVLHQNDGEFPPPTEKRRPATETPFRVTSETPYETRYAFAQVEGDGQEVEFEALRIASMDEGQLAETVRQLWQGTAERGYRDYYRYAVFRNGDGSGTVVLLDCYSRFQSSFLLLRSSLTVSAACVVMVLVLLVPLSKRAVRPFARNLERQNRFVTDASHELKTPLAIISANNDLTERISGETQWTRSTKTQVARLNALIRDLIDTARAVESADEADLPPLDLSELVRRCSEDFLPLADAAGKPLERRIEDGIWVKGDAEALERLTGVLLDNAVKHGDAGGRITLELRTHRRSVLLSVANPASDIEDAEAERLFDRFYRADQSRSRTTGGYGIGLSVAQGIAERHGGRLSVEKRGDAVAFTATLPRRATKDPERATT